MAEMIQLRTLGGLEIGDPDEPGAHGPPVQAKRTALLVYLALARPAGYHRRDTLLGLFWPESDMPRARGALRTSVHRLRQTLGPSVIVTRGKEELGIAPGAVWCDAVAFEDAIRSHQPEQALELYGGELLPGFFISDAPEFERWLERERERLQEQAAAAAWQLADRAEAAGERQAAAAWARRALAVKDRSEAGLRRLMTLLARVGEPAAALSAYEDFCSRLEADFGLQPSEQTEQLWKDIQLQRLLGAGAAAEAVPGTARRAPERPGGSEPREQVPIAQRQSLAARLTALEAARPPLVAGSAAAAESVRRIARSLRSTSFWLGSGRVAEVALWVEEGSRSDLVLHLDCLLAALRSDLARPAPPVPAAILVATPSPELAAAVSRGLAAHFAAVRVARDAAELAAILAGSPPSLLLLELELPGGSGPELLTQLRRDPTTAGLPVIALGSGGNQLKAAAMSMGADAYFDRSVDPAVLVAATSARLRRAGLLRREPRFDGVTGLPNRAAFREAFARYAALLDHAPPHTLALLEVDHFHLLVEQFGAPLGDDVLRHCAGALRRVLRHADVLGRWGDVGFAALFPHTDLHGAMQALEKARPALEDQRYSTGHGETLLLSFTAGLADVTPGCTFEEVLAEADWFLYLARLVGVPQLSWVGAHPPADVLRAVPVGAR
jgi:diguanylate cyclase (GGDEF)-like protein